MGDVARARDNAAVKEAAKSGGLEELVETLGLDCRLNPASIRKMDSAPSETVKLSEKTGEDKSTDSQAETPDRSLSQGQWQRVAIARAFMRAQHADLCIFDEVSSSLSR